MHKTKARDTSVHVNQREKVAFDLQIREFPWSERQKLFIEDMQAKSTKVMFLQGPAGSAKSLLAVYCALQALKAKKIGEIIYIRQPVESSKFSLGFLKGDLMEKMTPYLMPLQDKLGELLTKTDIDKLEKEARIKSAPIGHLRGRTFNNCYMIVDEAQNLSQEDILLVMTRLGKFGKLIMSGDIMQPDIKNSAFQKIADMFDDEESAQRGIRNFQFGKEDIFRNEILAFIIEKFQNMK